MQQGLHEAIKNHGFSNDSPRSLVVLISKSRFFVQIDILWTLSILKIKGFEMNPKSIRLLHLSVFLPKLWALTMATSASSVHTQDGRLWAMALALSLVVNIAFIGLLGFTSVLSADFRPAPKEKPVSEMERTITIFQDRIAKTAPAQPAPPVSNAPRYARTSDDQATTRPEAAAFIGERNTQATSSRVPIQSAPPLPSQGGVTPKNSDHLETVESTYRDGALTPPSASAPPVTPSPESNPVEAAAAMPPSKTVLAQGQNPVDVPVAKEPVEEIRPKAPPAELPKVEKKSQSTAKSLPKPPLIRTNTATDSPSFQGNQRKTAIVGSISRTGRSALNVVDSPLGRYQAVISRAVEQEWQRNCMRHRDFITPGFLTVRFFVETSGRVRTVQFVGDMETGEVQKGFTLNAIRDAEIPEMPTGLKKEFEKEPLELIFNFYF
jgi:hypothetical protein